MATNITGSVTSVAAPPTPAPTGLAPTVPVPTARAATVPVPAARGPTAPALTARVLVPVPTARGLTAPAFTVRVLPAPAHTSHAPAAPVSAAPAPRPHSSAGPRQRNKQKQQGQVHQIYVTGYPVFSQPQDLIRAFSKFGKVKLDRISNYNAILTYNTPEEALAAVRANRKIHIYGEYLSVKHHTNQERDQPLPPVQKPIPKREFLRSKQKDIIVEPKDIDLSGDFHEQLDRILDQVRLTQEEVHTISSLYADLENVLQVLWPGCAAVPFGSITTGLGIKTSDADCFLHIPDRYQHQYGTFVNRAKKVLQSYPQLFAEILSIPRANTPIVKFFHIPTGTNCDLSFKTPLGSQNSKLIMFLLHTDARLLPMAVAIKYWAKVHGLSGTGKITNYALTMMIIFYLQQPPISILPSVYSLQSDPANDVIVDYWNTGINKKDQIPQSTNTSAISELLGGFFEYYSTFNFDELMICPYLGTPIKKEVFKNALELPNEFQRYKDNVVNNYVSPIRHGSSFCIQDPFEQSHNVASGVSSRFAADVRAFINFAADAYEKTKLQGCTNFLSVILLQKPRIVRAKTNPEYRIHLFPKIIACVTAPDWKLVVRDIIFTIFEKMLKVKLVKIDNEKVNPESKKEKEKYVGTLKKPLWKRREISRMYSGMKLSLTEKQARITEDIIKGDFNEFKIEFNVLITFSQNPKSVSLSIKLAQGELEVFREFGKFFNNIVQNWVADLLRPHIGPPSISMPSEGSVRQVENKVTNNVNSNAAEVVEDKSTPSVKDEVAPPEAKADGEPRPVGTAEVAVEAS